MNKKILCLMLACVLAVSSFVGFGTKVDAQTIQNNPTQSTTESPVNTNPSTTTQSSFVIGNRQENEYINDGFDGDTAYKNLDWNVDDMGKAVQLVVTGYYGALSMTGTRSGVLLNIIYDVDRLAEAGEDAPAEHGDTIYLYMPTTGNVLFYDDTKDKDNPEIIYFESDSLEDSGVSMDSSISADSLFGDGVSYKEYKGAIKQGAKTVDVCSVEMKDESGQTITCDAYIDRDTAALMKIVKEADENNKYDYSMVMRPFKGILHEPVWADKAVKATEEQSMDIFSAIFGMMTIMSGQDVSSGLSLNMSMGDDSSDWNFDSSDAEEGWDFDVDDEYRMANPKFDWDTKLYDQSYWEGRLGSYSGRSILGNGKNVTIYDEDDNAYSFVWDETTQDYVESN